MFWYVTLLPSVSPATTLVLSSVSGVEITSPPPTRFGRLTLALGPPFRTPAASWQAALPTRSIESAIRRICTAVPHCWFDNFATEVLIEVERAAREEDREDRKSTRLNSSHLVISYAVFCL